MADDRVILSVFDAAGAPTFTADKGISVTRIHILDSNTFDTVFTIDQNTKFGATGPAGPTGAKGETGARGIQGNPGRPYAVGTSGSTAASMFSYNAVQTTSGASGDLNSWIQTYLVDQPPEIRWAPPKTTLRRIYFSWEYPNQINVGFTTNWLPHIESFTAELNGTELIVNADTTEFINHRDNNPYVTAIVLSNEPGTNGFYNVLFPQEVSSRRAYIYYNATVYPNGNMIQLWYSNHSSQIPNIVSIPFDTYR